MEIIMVGIGLSLKNGNGMYRKHSSQIHTKVITLLLNNLITSIRCLIPVKDFCRFTVIRLCLPTQYGMTVIVSSHLLSEIDQIAEDIGIIANGRLMYQGELNKLHATESGKSLEEIFLDLTGKEQSL